ncbi:phytanoyl-CoA dioxygenase family protein [Sphingosinicella terrae]|uniref:phytanoyl-CoA dioxygenase family protein n=1 Tax=Sphingosinicella terrae TaxID=2172047 RepID=UPI000E0DDEEE|nr:phytanoyl-CoA dioxygenase family protein [Sphingosinicella terrae]
MKTIPKTNSLVDRWTERLLAEGFCVIPDLVPRELVERLDADLAADFAETPFCEGRFYGERTKRFGRLLARSRHTAELVLQPLVTGIAERLLLPWCDRIQLNLTQAIAVHPGALAQMPHRDQDMWQGPVGEIEYLLNVMWPFTRYRRDNGATRLWPESHGPRALLPDPQSGETVAELEPGSALLFLGSTLHGAGANRSTEVRRGMVTGYSLGWLRTYENQFLAYPPEIARTFTPELAALIGYRQHRPNLGNYEGRCPSILLADTEPGPLAAADALRPHQRKAVDAHAFEQAA